MARADQLRSLERGIRRRLDLAVAARRVREALPAIVQLVATAGASYSIARWGLGHPAPVLTVTVTLTSLGLTRDARPRRVAESVLGIVLGVALSDGLTLIFGRGLWQVLVIVLVVLLVARAVSASPAFPVAAAVPSALVAILPGTTGGPFGRTLDAVIAGALALLATALLPRDPRRQATRDRHTLLWVVDEALGSVVSSLADADSAAGELGLARLRRTQPLLDAWSASLGTAEAVSRVSPFLRRHLPELRRTRLLYEASDLAVRHLRTISRRVEFLVQDGVPRPELARLIAEVAQGIRLLGTELDDPQLAGAARSLLVDLVGRLDPARLIPGAGVADAAIVLIARPLVVDLLIATGMPPADARALLPEV